jgi:Cu+-exporting ATPase
MDRSSWTSVEFEIQGMTCAACVGRVERAIIKVPNVAQASVNLATQRATIELNTSEEKSIDQIQQAIESAGYVAVRVPTGRFNRGIDPNTQLMNGDNLSPDRDLESLRRDFVISLIFAIPVFLIAMAPMLWPPLMDQMMDWMPMQRWNQLQWLLASIVQFWSAGRFYRNAYYALKNGSPDMNVLVAMGTSAAYGISALITLFPNWIPGHHQHVYFESSAVVICLVLLGKYLEARSKHFTQDALFGLAKLQPQSALRMLDHDQTVETPISQIALGDQLVVHEGQSIPLDGKILSGSSFIQEAMVTGEPIPKEKTTGDTVIGGTVNGNGRLIIRVTAIGPDTFLSRMTALVIEAQSKKPPIQSALDRIIRVFAPLVLGIAIATAIGWWTLSNENAFEKGLLHAVAILVVACPCALGLASPLSMMVGSGRAAQLGILFRSHEAIQKLAAVNSIVFDKTGTLTSGKPVLAGAWPVDPLPANTNASLVSLGGLVAKSSKHPIATAIAQEAKSQRSMLLVIQSQAVGGKGVQVQLSDQRRLFLGSYAWMKELGVSNEKSDELHQELVQQGLSISWLAIEKQIAGAFGVNDPIKPQAASAIATLRKMQIDASVLSGDQPVSVKNVASQLGIDRWFAEQSPQDKAERIREDQQQGKNVGFVGDGINDAPALSTADVGIAMSGGSDIAISSADVVLTSDFLPQVPLAIGLARQVMRNIYQNLFWAFAYNVVLIPLAGGWLTPWTNWNLTPMLAACAMGLSSLLVVGNALRLRSYQGFGY